MICSVRMNKCDLQSIGQLKLALRQILISKSSTKSKIFLVSSFKQTLKLTYQAKLKKTQQLRIQQQNCHWNSKSKSMFSSLTVSVSEPRQVLPSFNMKSYHRSLMSLICNEYQLRNHYNISLYDLQKQIDKAAAKYQRYFRQNNHAAQLKALVNIRQIQQKVRHILRSLQQMNQSIALKCQMVKDNINILKVEYSLLKAQIPKPNNRSKVKQNNMKIPKLLMGDENNNQILVNL